MSVRDAVRSAVAATFKNERMLGAPGGVVPFVLSPYLGQVATRSMFPNAVSGTNNSIMTRSAHIAAQAMTTAPQIGFPGFYTTGAGVDTVTTAVSLTYTASIEYPAGTFTQVTWSAAASQATTAVIPFSTLKWTGLSDTGVALAAQIPAGATYWIRNYCVTPGATGAGLVTTTALTSTRWSAAGEASVIVAGAGTDLTMSGTVTDGGSGSFVYPCCIVQTTSAPTFGVVGDSREIGSTSSGTAVDANGNMGQITRSLGAGYGYINVGIGGTQNSQFNATGDARAYFVNTFCSHVINGFGINDIRSAGGNRTAAQLQGDFFITGKRFPGKTLVACTLAPATTGTFATTAGQTADGNAAARQTFNTWVKTAPTPYKLAIDISSQTQDATLTDVWIANATADGLHSTQTNYDTIVSSAIINPAAIGATAPVAQFSLLSLGVSKTPIWMDFGNPAVSPPTVPAGVNAAGSRASFSQAGVAYGAASFNGGPGYVFNGTTSDLLGDASVCKPYTNGLAGVTIACLFSLTSNPSGTRSMFGATISGSNNERAYIQIDVNGKPGIIWRRLDADAATSAFSATPLTTGAPALLTAVFDPVGNAATLWVNGVQVATGVFLSTGNFSAANSNNLALCTLNSLFTAIVGREFCVFDSALSTANRQKVEGDLAWRNGLAAALLPLGHPYINAAPTS